ncbi:MAG: hypothetical protein JW932_20820 [Deltaproteobacteria bacterium]|nr:hypothetical protein [Deltaproteobacteria bacterium]
MIRVNMLCSLYDEAFQEQNNRAKKQLKSLIQTAKERGYSGGVKILIPDLAPDYVRKLCWNISSLLKDQDFSQLGINIDDGPRRPTY